MSSERDVILLCQRALRAVDAVGMAKVALVDGPLLPQIAHADASQIVHAGEWRIVFERWPPVDASEIAPVLPVRSAPLNRHQRRVHGALARKAKGSG